MKKFKYRAETYLRYLAHLRDQALHGYKDAEHRVLLLKKTLSGIAETMTNAFSKNAKLGLDGTTIHFINDNNQFIRLLRTRNKELQGELAHAEEVYKEKFENLMALQTQLRAIEKHREGKKVEFKKAVDKYDQKKIDDMNSVRYGGKGAGSVS